MCVCDLGNDELVKIREINPGTCDLPHNGAGPQTCTVVYRRHRWTVRSCATMVEWKLWWCKTIQDNVVVDDHSTVDHVVVSNSPG